MKNILKTLCYQISKIIPSKIYLRIVYIIKIHKRLNLKKPQTFNEKMQWLKLYDRKDIYTKMVDKYEVKEYVSKIIGEEYIIPTLGVYDNYNDIEFDKLPNSFVIKCTHDSGGVAICKDKSTFDFINAKKIINDSLKNNYYYQGREWPYKNVQARIIIEKYMEDSETKELRDYKFFCFNGVPKYVVIYSDREENTHNYSVMVYDMDWNAYPEFVNSRCPISDIIPRPGALEEMISIASRLSEPFPFVRVDLYLINGSPIFGEMTFTPDVISNITPELTDQMSKWIDITSLKQQL